MREEKEKAIQDNIRLERLSYIKKHVYSSKQDSKKKSVTEEKLADKDERNLYNANFLMIYANQIKENARNTKTFEFSRSSSMTPRK